MATINKNDFEVVGTNKKALFTLKVYRGEGMILLAMNWKKGKSSNDFVGFAIEYQEPQGQKFYSLKNRLTFLGKDGKVGKSLSTMLSPIQKFRWVHFPRNADMDGAFTYRVTPVFMNTMEELSYGDFQEVSLDLKRITYPNKLNVSFTRGFVSSQAFVDNYQTNGESISQIIPTKDPLSFSPSHSKANEALTWMGFEAQSMIINLLDKAILDKTAKVKVVAYDLNIPMIVEKLEKLGKRLEIIIDDSADHGENDSPESESAKRLETSTKGNVKRQNMGQLQHNKMIVVNGDKIKSAICGSTNFTWRGLYVQANNAVEVYGARAIKPFLEAFDNYWQYDTVKDFGNTSSALWNDLKITGIDAYVSFSPHIQENELLDTIATDIEKKATSSLFYSLAFLGQTQGSIRNSITKITNGNTLFIYGIADKQVGGFDLQKPNGIILPVFPSALSKNLPEPFKSEPTGGKGTRMHHKFIVIDFNKPTARVYLGSYNFSPTADKKNGENLLLVKDRKIAVSYMIEAIRIFDHYHFRLANEESKKAKKLLCLSKPPINANEVAWWESYYSDKNKVRDRELFA